MATTLPYVRIEVRAGLSAFVQRAPPIPEGPICARCLHSACEMCGSGWCDAIGPAVLGDDGVPIVVVDDDPRLDGAERPDGVEDGAYADDNELCCDSECMHDPAVLATFFAWADRAPKCTRCGESMSISNIDKCAQMMCKCEKNEECAYAFAAIAINAWIADFPPGITERNAQLRSIVVTPTVTCAVVVN